ncbi:MAG TPA: hypothetical protein VIJ51_10660 [Solirubrobacteraceae bacterium]
MSSHRGRLVGLLAGTGVSVIALAGGVASAAPAGFGAPIVLQAPSVSHVETPAVSVTSSGQVAAVWSAQVAATGHFGNVVRRGTTSGRFGAAERVPGAGIEPSVAVGRSGGAAVVWLSDTAKGGTRHVEASVALGHGHFGKVQVLGTVRAGIGPQEVFASGGRYVAVWLQGVPTTDKHALLYAVSNAAGHFGAARTLAANVGIGFTAVAGPDGTVSAAWRTTPNANPAENATLEFAELAPGAGVFGATKAGPDNGENNSGGLGLFSGPGGTALTWTDLGAASESLRELPIGPGVASAPQTVFTLQTADTGKLSASGPVLALPAQGPSPVAAFAVLAGTSGDSQVTTAGTVFATVPGAGGAFAAPVELSKPGTLSTQPVAGATSSTAVIAWTTGSFKHYGLEYAIRPASGSFGAARSLTSLRSEGPVTLSSSPGAVVATWVSGAAANHLGIDVAILRDAG